jgi:hypothetical protein
MSKPMIKIVNVQTGEEIEREMNEAELIEYEAAKELELKKDAEKEAKAAARQAILDRLGLTEDEAKILLG